MTDANQDIMKDALKEAKKAVADITINLNFFVNSGTQYDFKPFIFAQKEFNEAFKNTLGSFAKCDAQTRQWGAAAMQFSKLYPDIAKAMRERCEKGGTPWTEIVSSSLKNKGRFIRYRLGEQHIIGQNGAEIVFYGIWFALETNQGNNSQGPIIDITKDFQPAEINEALAHKDDPVQNIYMQLSYPSVTPVNFTCRWTMPTDPDEEDSEADEMEVDIKLKITLKKPNGDSIPVDIVLDLGNSRSVALLLQHGENNKFAIEQFATYCTPVTLSTSPWNHWLKEARPKDVCIISSSIVLQTPRFEMGKANKNGEARKENLYLHEWTFKPREKTFFDHAETFINRFKNKDENAGKEKPEFDVVKRTTRLPQMFVRLSPVLLGEEADEALDKAIAFRNVQARFYQSSPKRYFWDLKRRTASSTYWNMLPPPWDPNAFNENSPEIPTLECDLLRFMPEDGRILTDLNVKEDEAESKLTPNPQNPLFPRASTLTWMLLAILERAWEQTNSNTDNFIPKKLHNIIITYPAGWLPRETAMYRERCQEAVNIFSQTNFSAEDQQNIKLVMNIDEAVASQMPFVFTEITNFKSSTDWINLMGRRRGGKKAVRIMNLDIGGGTTDFSIIEYSSRKIHTGNSLVIDLLYKDGFAVAGDNLLRLIIDKIILGTIIKDKSEIKSLRKDIENKFKSGLIDPKSCIDRSLHVKQVLIPLAIHLLSLHNEHSQNFTFSPVEAGITATIWNNFVNFINPKMTIPYDERFHFSDQAIPEFINDIFRVKFETCAAYASAYGIDMLVLSGKTSEIPEITELTRDLFPMMPDRIIPTKNYQAGKWYPNFNSEESLNYIADAKTVTATGAALQFALSQQLISNWNIEVKNSFAQSRDENNVSNIWSTIAQASIGDAYLLKPANVIRFLPKEAETSENPSIITSGAQIFRQLESDSHPEPVYIFKHKGDIPDNGVYDVIFSRYIDEYNGDALKIDSVYVHHDDENAASYEDRENLADDYELILYPMLDNSNIGNWQESGLVIL